MFQANTELNSKPSKLNLDEIGMSWRELREAILNAHKPIRNLFFTGLETDYNLRIVLLQKVLCCNLQR